MAFRGAWQSWKYITLYCVQPWSKIQVILEVHPCSLSLGHVLHDVHSSVVDCGQLAWSVLTNGHVWKTLSSLCSLPWLYLSWLRASRENTRYLGKEEEPSSAVGSPMAVGNGQGSSNSFFLPGHMNFALLCAECLAPSWARGTEESLFLTVYPLSLLSSRPNCSIAWWICHCFG